MAALILLDAYMDRDQIRDIIQMTLREITDNDELSLANSTAPDEVAGWDSINNIKLLFALEEELQISFDTEELILPHDVDGLLDLVQSKVGQAIE